MNISARLASFILVGIAAGFTAGCSGGSGGDGVNVRAPDVLDGDRKQDPDFTATLVLKDATGQFRDTFSPGEQIVFEFSLTNLRDQPVTVERPTGQVYEFIVVAAGTRKILWQQSNGLSFTQAFEYDEFGPGETRTVSVTWDQDRDDGLPLLPGEYVARGFYTAVGSGLYFTHSEFSSVLLPFAIE